MRAATGCQPFMLYCKLEAPCGTPSYVYKPTPVDLILQKDARRQFACGRTRDGKARLSAGRTHNWEAEACQRAQATGPSSGPAS